MNWIGFPLLMMWAIRGFCQVDGLIVTTSEPDPKQVFQGDTIRAQPLNMYRRCTDVTESATSYTVWLQKGISSTVPVTFDSRSIPLTFNIYAVNGAGRFFLPVPWCTSSIFDQSSDELKHLSIDMLSAQYNFYRSKGYNQVRFLQAGSIDTFTLVFDFTDPDSSWINRENLLAQTIQIRREKKKLIDSIQYVKDKITMPLDSARQMIHVCRATHRILRIVEKRSKQYLTLIDSLIARISNEFDLQSRIRFFDLYYYDLNSDWQEESSIRLSKKERIQPLKRMNQLLIEYEKLASFLKELVLQQNGAMEIFNSCHCDQLDQLKRRVRQVDILLVKLQRL